MRKQAPPIASVRGPDLPEPQPLVVTEYRARSLMHRLRHDDARVASRRSQRSGAIWHQNTFFLVLSVAFSVAARGSPGRTDGRSVRREIGHSDDRRREPGLRRTSVRLYQGGARSGGGRANKNIEESRFRIAGKTQWLHVASTAWRTFYLIASAPSAAVRWRMSPASWSPCASFTTRPFPSPTIRRSGRTRRAHDEASAREIRRLSIAGGGQKFHLSSCPDFRDQLIQIRIQLTAQPHLRRC